MLSACLACLLTLAACAARSTSGPGSGRLPAGQDWPADPWAGRLYYDPAPLADTEAAWSALVRLGPSLSVPGAASSSVAVHRTKDLAVFRLEHAGYEYQSVDKPPWYATGLPYCGRLDPMADCPWPQTMRVRVQREERAVVDTAEIHGLELFTDNRLRLAHGQGLVLELAARDRGSLLDLADALAGLGAAHGFSQPPGPDPAYRGLRLEEAAALGVEHGVLVVSSPEGGPLARLDVHRLDVVLAVDGQDADVALLDHALAAGSAPRLRILAWERLEAPPWIRTRTFETGP